MEDKQRKAQYIIEHCAEHLFDTSKFTTFVSYKLGADWHAKLDAMSYDKVVHVVDNFTKALKKVQEIETPANAANTAQSHKPKLKKSC